MHPHDGGESQEVGGSVSPNTAHALSTLPSGIFADVAERIEVFVKVLIDRGETTPAATEALRQKLRRNAANEIDYESEAAAFANAYLLSNFWKVAAAIQLAALRPGARVLDLGAGSAAAALAALTHIAAHSEPSAQQLRLVLVDRSKVQLDLARAAVEHAHSLLAECRVRPWRADLQGLAGARDQLQSDLILLSHVLTENSHEVQPLVELAASMTAPGGTLLVVERPDDELWAQVDGYATPAMPTSSGVAELPPSINVPSKRFRWLALRQPQPTERWLAELLGAYFTAWRERSAARIREIFTDDASYHEKPSEPPMCGVDAIEDYWRRRVVPQEEPEARPLRVSYQGTSAICDWEARFRRDGYRLELRGTMVVDGDPATGQLRRLRERFNTVRVPLRS